MKRFFFSIAITLSFFTFAQSQDHYTIVIGTFLDAQPADFAALRPHGFVYAREMGGGLSQVMIGGFEQRAEAEQARSQVAAKGYSGAFVQQRFASEGQLVPVIQIATRTLQQEMPWADFFRAGDLYALIGKDQVKIATGPYASLDEAKQQLPAIRQMGFADAFVKQANTAILHRIDAFETGGILPGPAAPAPADVTTTRSGAAVPPSYDQVSQPSGNVPQAYGNEQQLYDRRSAEAAAFNLPNPAAGAVSRPNLHPRVKRNSALELQKALKTAGLYGGGLDGYYGNGTASAFEQFKLNNREFQKYLLLAEYMERPDQTPEESQLQQAIDNLLADPAARAVVERSSHPIGKAYYAYMLFQTLGPGPEVNVLMNSAIQQSFSGKKMDQVPPFDFTATYAYSNLTQLILHLHYIHSAPDAHFRIPCWIFQQHPAETTQAYATYATLSAGDFPLEFCDQFLSWEEVKALHAMAVDMNIDPNFNTQKIATAATRRAELYLAPQPVSQNESLILNQWNTNLWTSLGQWATQDPMNTRLVTAFRVLYHQSLSRFEDYFLDKGFSAEQAKGMALMTVFTVVGYHLERFV